MLCTEVETYIKNSRGLPFFYAVGEQDFKEVLNELEQKGFIIDRASDFCSKDDKFPDLGEIIDYFRTLDINYRDHKHVLIGLGECFALHGADYTEQKLMQLKDTTLGSAKVILLLRGITAQVRSFREGNPRLKEQQRIYISDATTPFLSVIRTEYAIKGSPAIGIKGLLHDFEDGKTGNCYVDTKIELQESLIPVSTIDCAYEAIKRNVTNLRVEKEIGTEEQWEALFKELQKYNNSLELVFENYDFSENPEEDLYLNCTGLEFKNWLFFLYLKQNKAFIKNDYLKWVVSYTSNYEELKSNILTGILEIKRSDKRFMSYYLDRKKIIKDFPNADMAIFNLKNDIDPQESIYRLTDSHQVECEEIIRWIDKHGYIKEIDSIYPALSQYLNDYIFDCGDCSEEITQYFKEYRWLKVTNKLNEEFLNRVIKNAENMLYTQLETRDSIILKIEDKASAYLYWIDALGVEYLAYISELARQRGLSIHVDIAYVELPTITCYNKKFYDEWPGPKKHKEPELDEIKHKDKGGYNYEQDPAPIHLVRELKVIEKAIDTAATELTMHRCRSFIIASDHGASRLAVINGQEANRETDTKSEHSGRCCKEFPNANIPYAIHDNGYLVLADYARLKNSRKANVEVHGGATLEEVLVPIITLTLKNAFNREIIVLNADSIYADRHEGTILKLYISDIENIKDVSVVIEGKKYSAISDDATHYTIKLYDMKRAKKGVLADVYDGDNLIEKVTFDIKSKLVKTSEEVDNFFKEDL